MYPPQIYHVLHTFFIWQNKFKSLHLIGSLFPGSFLVLESVYSLLTCSMNISTNLCFKYYVIKRVNVTDPKKNNTPASCEILSVFFSTLSLLSPQSQLLHQNACVRVRSMTNQCTPEPVWEGSSAGGGGENVDLFCFLGGGGRLPGVGLATQGEKKKKKQQKPVSVCGGVRACLSSWSDTFVTSHEKSFEFPGYVCVCEGLWLCVFPLLSNVTVQRCVWETGRVTNTWLWELMHDYAPYAHANFHINCIYMSTVWV